MFYLFASNSIINYGITYYYEKSKPGPSKMITPKCHGGVTGLAFISAFLAIKPYHMLLGSRLLPFFILPATYYMYEWYEYSTAYINEICRPAHLGAIVYGLIFGLVFRRFYIAGKIWKFLNNLIL